MGGQLVAAVEQPNVSGVQIALVYGVVRVIGGLFGVVLDRPEEICHETVKIVHGFELGRMWTAQQDGPGAKEGFNQIRNISKPTPNQCRNARFPAKSPGERAFQYFPVPQTLSM